MNVFCVAQAVNTALSFFVMLSCILYKCLYTVCDCLSAQCSYPAYPRPLCACSLTAISGRRSSAHDYTYMYHLNPESTDDVNITKHFVYIEQS